MRYSLRSLSSLVARRTLSDQTTIPWLSYGNGSEDKDIPFLKVADMVIDAGYAGIDTASGYAGATREQQTGDLLKRHNIKPGQLYITTKLSPRNDWKDSIPVKEIKATVLESIRKLQQKPDLYLIHMPRSVPAGQIPDAWRVLEDLRDEGILGSIGCSNFSPIELEEVLRICRYKPVVNQLECHPTVISHLQPLLDLHEAEGIQTSSVGIMTPILSGKGNRLEPILERIAREHSTKSGKPVSTGAVLALWQKARGYVAVTSSGNKPRIYEQAAIPALPDLTKDQADEITTVGKELYFRRYTFYMEEQIPIPKLPSH